MTGNLKIKSRNFGDSQVENPTTLSNAIVECTFCHTKYSVSPETIAGLSEPKFHCFCCDNVFVVEQQKQEEPPKKEEEVFVARTPEIREPVQPESQKEQMSFGFVSSLKIKHTVGQETATSVGSYHREKFKKEIARENQLSSFAQNNRDSFAPRSENRKPVSAKFIFGEEPQKEEVLPKIKTPNLSTQMESLKSFFNNLTNSAGNIIPTLRFPKRKLPSFSLNYYNNYSRQFSDGVFKVLFLITPVVLTLISLFALTTWVNNDPAKFSSIFSFAASDLHIPPAGAGVKNLSYESITLDNGEEVHVLSGSVYNNSDDILNNVVLEGAIFDANGRILQRRKIELGAGLDAMKISSLDSKMIEKLHFSPPQSKISLQPEEGRSFSMAFWEDMRKEAVYFTGRIYTIS